MFVLIFHFSMEYFCEYPRDIAGSDHIDYSAAGKSF